MPDKGKYHFLSTLTWRVSLLVTLTVLIALAVSWVTVSRDELLRRVWGMQAGDTRTLDVHIFRLRRKIEKNPENPEILHTIRGRGCRLAFIPRG